MRCDDLHDSVPELGYMAWHEDAENRYKKLKQRQIVCPCCGRFVWDVFFHHLPSRPITERINNRNYRVIGWEDPRPNLKYSKQHPPINTTCCLTCAFSIKAGAPMTTNRPRGAAYRVASSKFERTTQDRLALNARAESIRYAWRLARFNPGVLLCDLDTFVSGRGWEWRTVR